MGDRRWLYVTAIATGLAATTYGWLTGWTNLPERYVHRLELGYGTWAGLAWLLCLLLFTGIIFAMAVGRRRNYLPPTFLLPIGFTIASTGVVLGSYGLHRTRALVLVDDWDYVEQVRINIQVVPSLSPYLTIAGFVLIILGAVPLWRLAQRVRREALTALAKIDREIALKTGDVVVAPAPPEEPAERL